MVIQIKVCQSSICIVFVDSTYNSNEDHMELDFPISLSVQVGNKHAVLYFCFLELGIRPYMYAILLNFAVFPTDNAARGS
jgi:hypothetical protein